MGHLESWQRLSWNALGSVFSQPFLETPLQSLVSSSPLHPMLLGMIGSSLLTAEWSTNAMEVIHHRGMDGQRETKVFIVA